MKKSLVALAVLAASGASFAQVTISGNLTSGFNQNTTGTAAGLSSTLSVASGGTGLTTLTGVVYGNGASSFSAATAAQIVSSIGTTAVTNETQITNSGGWSVTPSGTKLYFNYNGTNVASLDSSGNLITLANITAYGTV